MTFFRSAASEQLLHDIELIAGDLLFDPGIEVQSCACHKHAHKIHGLSLKSLRIDARCEKEKNVKILSLLLTLKRLNIIG